jgi:hypothetical protein
MKIRLYVQRSISAGFTGKTQIQILECTNLASFPLRGDYIAIEGKSVQIEDRVFEYVNGETLITLRTKE